MRLRNNIKPPQRYSGDTWVPPPAAARVPRSARPSSKPPFIDYNPNLPPAVFPTLDQPRPSVDPDQQAKSSEDVGEQRGESSGNGSSVDGGRGDGMSWEPTLPRDMGNTVEESTTDPEDALMHNLRVSREDNPFVLQGAASRVGEAKVPRAFPPTVSSDEDKNVDAEFFRSCEDDPNV